MKAVVENNPTLEPYIAVIQRKEILQAYLVVDKQVIDQVPVDNLAFSLLSAFFDVQHLLSKGVQ